MLRAVKVRLYPNKVQEQELNKVLGCYRFVYNHMLAKKQNAYEIDKTKLSLCDLQKYFHGTLLKDDQLSSLIGFTQAQRLVRAVDTRRKT